MVGTFGCTDVLGMANSTKVGLKGSFSVTYMEAEETFRPSLAWQIQPKLV